MSQSRRFFKADSPLRCLHANFNECSENSVSFTYCALEQLIRSGFVNLKVEYISMKGKAAYLSPWPTDPHPSACLRHLKVLYLHESSLPLPTVLHALQLTTLTCLKLQNTRMGTDIDEGVAAQEALFFGLRELTRLEALKLYHVSMSLPTPTADRLGLTMAGIAAVGSLKHLYMSQIQLATSSLHCFSSLTALENICFEYCNFNFPDTVTSEFNFVCSLKRLSKFGLTGTRKSCNIASVLASLEAVESLQVLRIECYNVSDIVAVTKLRGLTRLTLQLRDLAPTQVCSLTPLSQLTNLQSLSLNPVQAVYNVGSITDRQDGEAGEGSGTEEPQDAPSFSLVDSLHQLAPAMPSLKSLKLNIVGEEDVSLRCITSFHQLTSFTLACIVPADELRFVPSLSQLRELVFDLDAVLQLTGQEMHFISKLTSLEVVNLYPCDVPEEGLWWLNLLPRLQTVKVNKNLYSSAKQVLPRSILRVERY